METEETPKLEISKRDEMPIGKNTSATNPNKWNRNEGDS